MKSTLALFLLGSLLLMGAEALFEQGHTSWSIRLPSAASEAEVFAADELSRVLRKISGAQFPVVRGDGAALSNGPGFELGTPESLPRLQDEADELGLSDSDHDAIVIRTQADGVLLAGSNPRSVIYAVHEFLRRELGVRWLWFGEDGEFAPSRLRHELGEVDYRFTPPFRYRDMTPVMVGQNRDTEIWFMRSGMNMGSRTLDLRDRLGFLKNDIGHFCSLSRQWDPDIDHLYEEHPEYFQLVGGKRQFLRDGQNRGCWSSPGYAEYLVRLNIRLAAERRLHLYSTIPADTSQRCQCPECQGNPLDPSAQWFQFYGKLIEGMRREMPQLKFYGTAYHEYQAVPGFDLTPLGLEFVAYCNYDRCQVHRLDDSQCHHSRESLDMLRRWSEKAPLGVYGYHFDTLKITRETGYYYMPLWNIVADEIRHLRQLDGVYCKTEFVMDYYQPGLGGKMPADSQDWQMPQYVWRLPYYVYSRMAWDPAQDAETLVRDFCQTAYGPAADAMCRYHTMMAASWEAMPLHLVGFFHRPREIAREFITPQIIAEGRRLLGQAMAEADALPEGPERERLLRNLAVDHQNFEKWVATREALGPQEAVTVSLTVPADEELLGLPRVNATQADNEEFSATEFAFYCAGDALHILAVCAEADMRNFREGHPCHDAGFSWGEENLEVLLVTASSPAVLHIAFNSAGGVFDERDGDAGWDRQWFCRVDKGDDHWVMDIALPFASLDQTPRPGDTWRINLIRNRSRERYSRCGFPTALNGPPMPNTFAELHFTP